MAHIRDFSLWYTSILEPQNSNPFDCSISEMSQDSFIAEIRASPLLPSGAEATELLDTLRAELYAARQQKEEVEVELEKLRTNLEDRAALHELLQRKQDGVSSVYKGACDEQYVKILLRQALQGTEWELDDRRKMNMMDLRIHRGDVVVGVECKDRKKITQADLDKFHSDHDLQRFSRSIFIATSAIPKLLPDPNTLLVRNNFIYVHTVDHVFLAAVLMQLVQTLPCQRDTTVELGNVLHVVTTLYTTWQNTKKELARLDRMFLQALAISDLPMEKNHIYIKNNASKGYSATVFES